jgi:predicted O-methyltransferase YrrM
MLSSLHPGSERLSFDLVFADAVPGKYEDLEGALAVVKAGGFYVIDEKVPVLIERLAANAEVAS